MEQADPARTPRSWAWLLLLLVLVAPRIPSLVQPAGGDQFLYSYVAQRVLAGDVPYRDAFEQKPPGIFLVYAAVWGLWPNEAAIAAADLVAAVLAAGLLVGLGRRMFGGRVGEGAAALFLLLGDPGIQRLGGMNVRAQCETFIALAVTAALSAAWRSSRSPMRWFLAGVLGASAFWLKYNAAVYAIPILIAATSATDVTHDASRAWRPIIWLAAGAGAVLAAGLAWFVMTSALMDLWLATIRYNVAYSGETYQNVWHPLRYLATMPVTRAFVDGLWFVGGLGAAVLLFALRDPWRPRLVALAWVGAAVLSIAINGSRGLPQYFVQAAPALALSAAAGLAVVWRSRAAGAIGRRAVMTTAVVLLVALWRVGIEATPLWRPRLFGVPQAVSNAFFDARYARGDIDRDAYLARFGREEAGKYSPAAVERLAYHVRENTTEPILVFGFASGGVLVKSGRPSASRFFWSRPIVLEFEASRPGYGSRGLSEDLKRTSPAIVALQKRDWGIASTDERNSEEFFMSSPFLKSWLLAGYVPAYEDAAFVVWRRRN